MGEIDESRKIKGQRYARNLLEDGEKNIIKDHWDHKGKANIHF